jgi:hypothetical protein
MPLYFDTGRIAQGISLSTRAINSFTGLAVETVTDLDTEESGVYDCRRPRLAVARRVQPATSPG